MKKIIVSLVFIVICTGFNHTIAQESPAYSGMFNVGILYGSNKSKIQAQTIHGLQYRGWFAGVGGGIDDYFQQSIPIFLDVRKSILNKPNTPFVYADGGINLVTKGTKDDWRKVEMKAGVFYEGGLGYKIALAEKLALNLAVGYSAKTYTQNTFFKRTIPTPPYFTDDWTQSNKEDFNLQRFVMKIGLQF